MSLDRLEGGSSESALGGSEEGAAEMFWRCRHPEAEGMSSSNAGECDSSFAALVAQQDFVSGEEDEVEMGVLVMPSSLSLSFRFLS